MEKHAEPQEKLCLSRAEAAAALGVSPSKLREMLGRGDVRELRAGRRSLIPRSELVRFISDRLAAGPHSKIEALATAPDVPPLTSQRQRKAG